MYNGKKFEKTLVDLNISALALMELMKPERLSQEQHQKIFEEYHQCRRKIAAFLLEVSGIFELQQAISTEIYREHQGERFSDSGLYKTAPDRFCNTILDVRIDRKIDPDTGEILPAKGVCIDAETGEETEPSIGCPAPTDAEVLAAVEKIEAEGVFKK